MNILILNWRDPKHPLAGGAEISLLQHASYWRKKGAQITWFASSYRNSKRTQNLDGINIVRKGNHYTVSLFFFLDWLRGKYHDSNLIIDCFHFIPFLTPLYIKKIQIIGLINEVAGKIWFENMFRPFAFIGFKIEPYLIRLYKNIPFITSSKSTLDDLVKIGIKRKKIAVIYHGFTPFASKKVYRKEKNPTILFLGRLSKDKGIEDALLMLELLIRDNNNLVLWVVGKFENKNYEKRVKGLISEFRVEKNCVLFGYVSEDEKAELMQRAWFLIHPSVKEGWGLNVIEANSLGTPVVGYDVAGLRDSIIDNKTGILVRPDAISLADEVENLLKNEKKLEYLGSNAQKWSNTFSWEKASEESYRLLKKYYYKVNIL